VLQPAMFRYVESPSEANTPDARAVEWVRSNAVLVASAACVMVLLLTFGVALVVRAIRRKPAA